MLNAKASSSIKWQWINVECTQEGNGGVYYGTTNPDTKNIYPTASLVLALGGRRSGTNDIATACVDTNGTVFAHAMSSGTFPILIVGFYNQNNT